jgi:hypothetical protein
MAFKTMSTQNSVQTEASKTLVIGLHGAGKTTQFKNYQKTFGKGLIISGESGLRSLKDTDIDYLPFSSWNGENDPAKDVYSFKGIAGMIAQTDLKAEGFKWIGLDSLTEASDQCHKHLQEHPDEWQTKGGKPNPLELWQKYGTEIINALKWLRDLPVHVCVTGLVKSEQNDVGGVEYWPMVKGGAVGRQIPGIFDFVFGLIKMSDGGHDNPTVSRRIITDEVHGWKCKARDPFHRLKPVEEIDSIPELLLRVDMDDPAYAAYVQAMALAKTA